MTDAAASADPVRSRASWIGFVVGIPIMLFGIGGALVQSGATHPVQFATWLVGADLLHDVLVAPAVCLIGFGLSRIVPPPWRAPLGAALVTSAVVVAVAWAPLHGYGRIPDNPSLQPLDYRSSVATAIAIVWVVCAAWGGLRAIAHRRATRTQRMSEGAERA